MKFEMKELGNTTRKSKLNTLWDGSYVIVFYSFRIRPFCVNRFLIIDHLSPGMPAKMSELDPYTTYTYGDICLPFHSLTFFSISQWLDGIGSLQSFVKNQMGWLKGGGRLLTSPGLSIRFSILRPFMPPLFPPDIWSHMPLLPTTSTIQVSTTPQTFHRSIVLAYNTP